MALLEREMHSDSILLNEEEGRSLNLTSSGFIEDLNLDSGKESDFRPSPPPEVTIMPRPLKSLKLRLFHGSAQDSSSSRSSLESSPDEATWRRLPSRETCVPEELESVEESQYEDEGASGKQSEEGQEELSEAEGEDVAGEDVEEEPSPPTLSPSSSEEPEVKWEIDQVKEDDEPTPPTTKRAPRVFSRPVSSSALNVDDRIDEDACLEDFDRREVSRTLQQKPAP